MNQHHSIITYKISEGLSISVTYRIDQLQAIQVMFGKILRLPLLLLLKRKTTLFIKQLFKNLNESYERPVGSKNVNFNICIWERLQLKQCSNNKETTQMTIRIERGTNLSKVFCCVKSYFDQQGGCSFGIVFEKLVALLHWFAVKHSQKQHMRHVLLKI